MKTNTLRRTLIGLALIATATAGVSTALAYGPIVGDFNNPTALSRIYNQANNTFAFWSKKSGSTYTYCDAPNQPGCLLYSVSGPASVADVANLRVESTVYPHFHLGFEDPALGACFANGGFGRKINGQCVAPDWSREPRTVSPHDSTEWIDIWVEGFHKGGSFVSGPGWDSTGRRQFDLMSFDNKGDVPVQLWVQWYDGSWWVWDNLGPGVHDVSGWAYWILDAQMGQPNSGSVITIDDVVVDHIVL